MKTPILIQNPPKCVRSESTLKEMQLLLLKSAWRFFTSQYYFPFIGKIKIWQFSFFRAYTIGVQIK